MGKYRDHRQPRRQGFDIDYNQSFEGSVPQYFDSRPPAMAPAIVSMPALHDAEVLWLSLEKGFGFLKLDNGSEAFMHLSKLQAAGHAELPKGSVLTVRTEPGPKGPQVVEVVSVAPRKVNDAPLLPVRAEIWETMREADSHEQQACGVVKRYDSAKGFGFVMLSGGGRDVFFHVSTLTRNGLSVLEVGQSVVVTYCQGQKGPEARKIWLSKAEAARDEAEASRPS